MGRWESYVMWQREMLLDGVTLPRRTAFRPYAESYRERELVERDERALREEEIHGTATIL